MVFTLVPGGFKTLLGYFSVAIFCVETRLNVTFSLPGEDYHGKTLSDGRKISDFRGACGDVQDKSQKSSENDGGRAHVYRARGIFAQ